jgi:hypothetical protein
MVDDGYTWVVCQVCGRDKIGMRRGQTLSIKFRERLITVVGGVVSAQCTYCGAITTVDLSSNQAEKVLLEGEAG